MKRAVNVFCRAAVMSCAAITGCATALHPVCVKLPEIRSGGTDPNNDGDAIAVVVRDERFPATNAGEQKTRLVGLMKDMTGRAVNEVYLVNRSSLSEIAAGRISHILRGSGFPVSGSFPDTAVDIRTLQLTAGEAESAADDRSNQLAEMHLSADGGEHAGYYTDGPKQIHKTADAWIQQGLKSKLPLKARSCEAILYVKIRDCRTVSTHARWELDVGARCRAELYLLPASGDRRNPVWAVSCSGIGTQSSPVLLEQNFQDALVDSFESMMAQVGTAVDSPAFKTSLKQILSQDINLKRIFKKRFRIDVAAAGSADVPRYSPSLSAR